MIEDVLSGIGKYKFSDKVPEDNLTYFIQKIFSTEDGKRLLAELKEEFLCKPVSPSWLDERHACYREGQNDLVRMFFRAVEEKK